MAFISSFSRAACLGAAFLVCGLAAAPAFADSDSLTLGVGAFDVVNGEDNAVAASLEYRSGHELWVFHPIVGLMGTTDESVYGYGGLALDMIFGEHWYVTPSIAAGLYVRNDGRDLGVPLEFRSALAVGYRFDNGVRAGISFFHLSNAGISEHNPGTEVLMATYGIPLGR